jgi:hypothetical protein
MKTETEKEIIEVFNLMWKEDVFDVDNFRKYLIIVEENHENALAEIQKEFTKKIIKLGVKLNVVKRNQNILEENWKRMTETPEDKIREIDKIFSAKIGGKE